MFDSIRAVLFRKALRKMIHAQKRARKTHTLESAVSIGILFDATAEKDRTEVLAFSNALKEKNKKIRLLAFVDAQHPLGQSLFPQFTQKETTWTGAPKSEAVQAFTGERFDLLLCLNAAQVPLLHWVAAATQASMKIGTYTDAPNDFDMLLETPAEKGIRFFVEQLDHYLNKIVPGKHEPSTKI